MTGKRECELGGKFWDCVGVTDKDRRRRALARLRKVDGDYEIADRIGRASILRRKAGSTSA
jgi:hypothetical protein